MKIIQFGNDNFLVIDADDTPIFEVTVHCTVEDMKLFTNTEIHTLISQILAKFRLSKKEEIPQ